MDELRRLLDRDTGISIAAKEVIERGRTATAVLGAAGRSNDRLGILKHEGDGSSSCNARRIRRTDGGDPCRIWSTLHLSISPRLNEERAAADAGRSVVDDCRFDGRHRVRGLDNQLTVRGIDRVGTASVRRIGTGHKLGVVRPAVVIRIVERIKDAAVSPLRTEVVLPVVVDPVVIGEHLAEVELARLAEVVDAGTVSLSVLRIKLGKPEHFTD